MLLAIHLEYECKYTFALHYINILQAELIVKVSQADF